MADTDFQVQKIQQEALKAGFNLSDITKHTAGSYNQVYKATLQDGTKVVFRIFRSKSWPEDGKLEWISKTLTSLNIPTAKILYSIRENEQFKNGFVIQEFIDGDLVKDVIDRKIIYTEYYKKLGKLIKQIHSINIDNFGYIGSGSGNQPSFINYIAVDIDRFFERIETIKDKIATDQKKYKDFILNELEKLAGLKPVLNHNDLSPDNVMLNSNVELVLVDWDNAVSSIWINDFAVMTYWMKFTHENKDDREKYISEFLTSYNPDLSLEEIRYYEKIFHSIQALNLLGYYYFDAKLDDGFIKTLVYFNYLVSGFKIN